MTDPVNAELEPIEDAPVADAPAEEPTVALVATLTVKRGGVETEDRFVLNPPATIGRFDPSVGPIDVDLGNLPEGSYVSRKHAKIEQNENGSWTIRDLGSSNGTFVLRDDFERIEEAELTDGTEFALGNARFVFRTGQESAE